MHDLARRAVAVIPHHFKRLGGEILPQTRDIGFPHVNILGAARAGGEIASLGKGGEVLNCRAVNRAAAR